MERQTIILGKIGPRYMGIYSPVTKYLVADYVLDSNGNVFSSKKGTSTAPNVGRALPVVNEDGTVSTSEWWGLMFNFSQLKRMVEDFTANYSNQMDEMNEETSSAIENAKNATVECEELTDYVKRYIIPELIGEPTILKTSYLSEICIKNKVAQKIAVELLPKFCSQSALFQRVEGDSLSVNPSGELKILKVGSTKFHVIPTYNTGLWEEIDITVREPIMRTASAASFRIANGKVRIY